MRYVYISGYSLDGIYIETMFIATIINLYFLQPQNLCYKSIKY